MGKKWVRGRYIIVEKWSCSEPTPSDNDILQWNIL